jgi:hypothetical protein
LPPHSFSRHGDLAVLGCSSLKLKHYKNMSNLINFKNSIINNGGATYNLMTGEFNPDHGYIVSIKGYEDRSKFNEVSLQHKIVEYVKKNADVFIDAKNHELFLGGWIDNGELFLDVSVLIEDKDKAIRVAILNSQLAYYDCKLGKSINP